MVPFRALVHPAQPRKPPWARHHQRLAEGRGVPAIGKRQALAPRLVFARRHGLVGHEEIMQPARPGQAHLQRGVEHRGGIPQQGPRMVDGERLQEGLGREPRPTLEQMGQMGLREAHMIRDVADRGLRLPVLAQKGDGPAHMGVIRRSLLQRGRCSCGLFKS